MHWFRCSAAPLLVAIALAVLVGCSGGRQQAGDAVQEATAASDTEHAGGAASPPAAALAGEPEPAFLPDGSYHAGTQLPPEAPVPLATVLASIDQYAGTAVRIEGEIQEVCPQRGCWMLVRDGAASARVTFKDYAFFVPKDAAGSRVSIVAEFSRQTLTEEVAKHLAAETKGGDPDAIQGSQEVIAVVAAGVDLHRAAAAAAPASSSTEPAAGSQPSPAH